MENKLMIDSSYVGVPWRQGGTVRWICEAEMRSHWIDAEEHKKTMQTRVFVI